jgi:Tfp pilus assembly PilM family ATPase
MAFSKHIVGIEINDHVLQLIELKQAGKVIEMTSYSRVKLAPGVVTDGNISDVEELEKNLKTLFAEANPKALSPKTIAVLMPAKKVFTHVFHFDHVRKIKNIPLHIQKESETVIPLTLDELYWDFRILNPKAKSTGSGKERHKKLKVLFGGIEKFIADDFANLLVNMGIQPILFGTNIESLYHALKEDSPKQKGKNKKLPSKTQFIIEFGAYSIDYLILKDTKIHYHLSSNKGIKHLTENLTTSTYENESALFDAWKNLQLDPENLQHLKDYLQDNFKEARQILASKKNQLSETIEVLVTGEYASLPYFYDYAKNTFSELNVMIGDPKQSIKISDQQFIKKQADSEKSMPFSVFFTNTIGLTKKALISKPTEGVNLLPTGMKKVFRDKKIILMMIITSIFMTLSTLTLGTYISFQYLQSSYTFDLLNIEKNGIERVVFGTRYQSIQEELTSFNQQVQKLTKIEKDLFSVPKTLEAVLQAIPEETIITSYGFDEDTMSIAISGIANDRDELLLLQQNLQEQIFISDINFPISNFDKKNDISFSIKVFLEPSELPAYDSE